METKSTNPFIWLLLVLVAAVGSMTVFAAALAPSMGGYGMMTWGMGWGAILMVVPILFLILIMWVVLNASSATPVASPIPTALEGLNARYVRGEVGREEYVRIRADLEGTARSDRTP